MRGLVITLLLVSVGMVWACWADGPTATDYQTGPQAVRPTGWRRTETGWELAHDWAFHEPPGWMDGLHPAVPAALMALISAGALIALPAHADKRRGAGGCPPRKSAPRGTD